MPRHNRVERHTQEPSETVKELVTMETFEEMEVPLKKMIVELRNLEELIRTRTAGMTEIIRAFNFKIIPIAGQITEMKGQYTRALEQAVLLGKKEEQSLEEFIAERAKEKEQSDILHNKPQEVTHGDER